MAKIILSSNMKGGVGKSTITFNLAVNISSRSKVAIIDFDIQSSLFEIKELVTDFDIIQYKGEIKNIPKLEYDFIFIDTSLYLSNYLPELIELEDLIIVPTKAGILDLLAIKSTLELIEQVGKTNETLIVFNMVKPNTTLTLDILIGLEEYNVNIANTHVSDLVAFTRSVLVNGVSNDKNAQKQIDSLTKEILTKLI